MSSRNYNGKKEEKTVEEDEVDKLLKVAQDDMLLKLSLNSHFSSQISGIDPDLDSRFQALKKPHHSKSNSKSSSKSKLDDTVGRIQKNPEKILKNIDESDDLFARFAALKSSLPSYNTTVRDSQVQQQQLLDDDGDGEEDEVEKVIKWAIDAARLDPSPPSDSDDDAASDADDDSDDEDDDGHGVHAGKKGKRK